MGVLATRTDITTRTDVDTLLQNFYTRIFEDDLLGRIFVEVARMDLERHLPTLGDFWEKVLFNTGVYGGQMMNVHRRIHELEALTPAHFERWLDVWDRTIDATFVGTTADQAKAHAARIAVAMQRTLTRAGPAWVLSRTAAYP